MEIYGTGSYSNSIIVASDTFEHFNSYFLIKLSVAVYPERSRTIAHLNYTKKSADEGLFETRAPYRTGLQLLYSKSSWSNATTKFVGKGPCFKPVPAPALPATRLTFFNLRTAATNSEMVTAFMYLP